MIRITVKEIDGEKYIRISDLVAQLNTIEGIINIPDMRLLCKKLSELYAALNAGTLCDFILSKWR